jgi:hypothetical protein
MWRMSFRPAERKAQQLHYLIGRSVVRSLLMKFADSHGNAGRRQISKPSIQGSDLSQAAQTQCPSQSRQKILLAWFVRTSNDRTRSAL